MKFDDIEKNKICKIIFVGEDEYRYICIGVDIFFIFLVFMMWYLNIFLLVCFLFKLIFLFFVIVIVDSWLLFRYWYFKYVRYLMVLGIFNRVVSLNKINY